MPALGAGGREFESLIRDQFYMTKKFLVVGAGLAGAVYARTLAEHGHNVDLIDQRCHIGGNCYDEVDKHGIRIHKYGAHIFHTSNTRVVDWLSKYTTWRPYQHRVLAKVAHDEYHVLPINKKTAEKYSLEAILDTFYRPYTFKMWGKKLEELNPKIQQRVPIRDDDNELYFPNDQYQMLPEHGYTEMFSRILDHDNIRVTLGTKFDKSFEANYDHIFNSMSIDEYYDYDLGQLPYRSIKFVNHVLPEKRIYQTSVVNFTTWTGPTRVIEWKNFPGHGESDLTVLTYEYPCAAEDNDNERYYPIQDLAGNNRALYDRYLNIQNNKVTFIGRCGTYQYLDMHQVVSSSLSAVNKFLNVDSKL